MELNKLELVDSLNAAWSLKLWSLLVSLLLWKSYLESKAIHKPGRLQT